ncbi:MAG: outer membrane beta-barrel protein [Halarcobacter sp.]
MKVLNNIKTLSLLSLVVFAVNLNADSSLEKTLDDKNVYVGVSLGYSNLHMSKDDKVGSVALIENIDSSSKNILLETGFEYNKNLEFSLNYQRVDNDDVNLDNVYVSLKYKFPQDKFTPYVAANLGYSQLSWQTRPVATINNDTSSGSYLVGTTLGLLYPLTTKVSLNLNYQVNMLDHETSVESLPNRSILNHDLLQSFNVGIRYTF